MELTRPKRPAQPARAVVGWARAVLVVGSGFVAIILLGPFQGAEQLLFLSDKQAHTLAFFIFTAVLFVAFPKLRRTDLAMTAVALAASSEIAQALVGRDGNVADTLADAAGVVMALVPTYLNQIRGAARQAETPRRRRGDRPRAAAQPTGGPAHRAARRAPAA